MTLMTRFTLLLLFSVKALFAQNLVIIGGGLETSNRDVYEKIISLAGGKERANIAIFGVNSGYPEDSIKFNQETFESLYKVRTTPFPLDAGEMKRIEDAIESLKETYGLTSNLSVMKFLETSKILPEELGVFKSFREATGIYFGGGDQSRSKALFFRKDGSETYLLSFMRHQIKKGVVFSGTSAGAAMQSNPMITSGTSLASLRRSGGEATFEKGFGFLDGVVVDQHFGQRGRLGRLLTSMHRSDTSLGVGVDEDTALVVSNGKWSVRGSGHAYILELSTNGMIQGSSLSVLSKNDSFDPQTRKVIPAAKKMTQTALTQARRGSVNYKGKAFGPLEIEKAIKELRDSQSSRVNTWNAPKGKGVGMAFISGPETKFSYLLGATNDRLTVEKLSVNLLNVPKLNEKFPARKSCAEIAALFLKF